MCLLWISVSAAMFPLNDTVFNNVNIERNTNKCFEITEKTELIQKAFLQNICSFHLLCMSVCLCNACVPGV